MPINAITWKEATEEEEGLKYKIQIQDIAPRSINKVRRSLKEWSQCGEGTNHRTKRHLLFYTRVFEGENEMKKWAKSFPYGIHEETARGKLKPLNDIAKGK